MMEEGAKDRRVKMTASDASDEVNWCVVLSSLKMSLGVNGSLWLPLHRANSVLCVVSLQHS